MHWNPLLQTDSYKLSHFVQYPPGTTNVYSYLESRGGWFDEVVFFGLQYYLQQYIGQDIDNEDIEEAERFAAQHFAVYPIFNKQGWLRILNRHGGFLPIRIRAVPEGTVVGTHNVLMTVENTDPECFWLTSYLETLLLKVWYPITVATLSREIKKVIKKRLEQTADSLDGLDFKLHDFGYRGVSSEETAAIGGAAHLINFKGSDTIAGIRLIQQHYSDKMPGFSIPAAEHSTITAWGNDPWSNNSEYAAYKNMLDKFEEGLVAVVSDSYDLENAVKQIWGGRLKSQVEGRHGTVVIRPDSGNPREIIVQVLEWLGDSFGWQTNSKGYRVLSPRVRVIQGDGVNYHTIQDMLTVVQRAGWSTENVAFGMGGALLQQLNRDTQRFAFKCSSVIVNGEERAVCKTPKTDMGKASKAGRFALVYNGENFQTVVLQPGIENIDDCLETVFENGKIVKFHKFSEIRERAAL
jgi:nicotinamide phosphoribosyltransferase